MVEQSNSMQDLVPNDIYSLRLAESLTARACEVYHEDETPHRIPLRGDAPAPLRCTEGSAAREPTDLLCSSAITLTSVRAMSRAWVRAAWGGGSMRCCSRQMRPYQAIFEYD